VRNWLVPRILIWGLFGNFCVCIQTQSNLVIIITSPRLLSGDVLLFHVSFSLLLHHPDCCWVMYCYSIIITSPRLLSGDVLLFHVSFSLLLHHPDCCRVMYCYSTFLFHYYYYSYSSTHFCPLYFSGMP
jgi:hypothetical protein